MRSLALDQALKTTGWAVLDGDKVIEHGTFTLDARLPIEQRLGGIWTNLNGLSNEWEFSKLYFEDVQKQANAQTYLKLAYVQATVLLWCFFNEIPYTILSPSKWRSILKSAYGVDFGKQRQEQKQVAMKFAQQRLGIKNIDSDSADAICIGIAGRINERSRKSAF